MRRDSSKPRCEHPHGKHGHLQLRRDSSHQKPGHPEQLDPKPGEDLRESRLQRPASAPRLRQDAALPGAVAPVPVLDEQHHKDFATVWSSVWFRTHKGSEHGYSKELEAWTESKGVLQRLSCKMPVAKMHVKDPAKALQLVVASSGLLPAWLPESLDMEDEEDLNDALVQVTGTVFKHWCHARESEVRVDDLPEVMADLGIAVSQELLDQVLLSNIYATLDWPDFVSVLKDYRRLERGLHREIFRERSQGGRLGAEDVEELLKSLGHPAALQSCGRSRKASLDFKAFEEFLRQLRLSEGFSQHDLRELHAFFEVEKTSEMARREPICRCGLQKVQQVMMLRGFPTTEEEVKQMAFELDCSDGVSFRGLLRMVRCLRDLERRQMLDLIERYSAERRHAIQVVDLPLALGGLGYYPDEEAIREHLESIGSRESQDCLTPEELAFFLQKYRQVGREGLKRKGPDLKRMAGKTMMLFVAGDLFSSFFMRSHGSFLAPFLFVVVFGRRFIVFGCLWMLSAWSCVPRCVRRSRALRSNSTLSWRPRSRRRIGISGASWMRWS